MTRSSAETETKLADTALKLAAKKGWKSLTLEQVVRAAKIPKALVVISDKNQLLPIIIKVIDRKSLQALDKGKRSSAPHDRLFEAIMARFDQLQLHRQGILAIMDDIPHDPALARFICPCHVDSMKQILSWSGIPTRQSENPLIKLGLLGIYYRTICCWKKDSSADMSRTMAALDQALRLADKAAGLLFRVR